MLRWYGGAMTGWTTIFRVGRHTDSSGVTRDFTAADLDRMVASYDPAAHEAPLVIGHPKTDSPAYGWVAALKREGDKLLARFKDVPNQVKELVRQGRYRKVSVALYPNGTVRHVGLLGATPPAVKGLGSVAFDDGDAEIHLYEFADIEGGTMSELERLRQEKAEAEAKAREAEKAAKEAEEARAAAEKAAKEAEEAKAKAEAEFAEFRAAEEAKAREARFEKLVEAGKALPGEKAALLSLAGALAGAGELTFAEGGSSVKRPAEEALWRLLESRPANGLLDEFAERPPAQEPGDEAGGDYAAKF